MQARKKASGDVSNTRSLGDEEVDAEALAEARHAHGAVEVDEVDLCKGHEDIDNGAEPEESGPVLNHTSIVRPEPTVETLTLGALQHVQDTISVTRSEQPVNEFESNGRQIMQTFWYHFPLQRGLTQYKGSIPTVRTRHLLEHCSGRFARDSDFILFLANQRQRHAALQSTKRACKVHNERFAEYEEVVNAPDFPEKLEEAVQQPNSRAARQLMKKLLPLLSIASSPVPWSSSERGSCIGMMLAMARRYGPPSCFLTIAPDDVHDPTCIRLAITHRSNESFPAVADGFMEALQQGDASFAFGDGDSMSLKEGDLQALAAESPAATAMGYQNLIEVVLAKMYGIPIGSHTRTSKAPEEHGQGMLGTPVGYFGVTEVSGRCAEHLHIVFFGGATPDVLSGCVDDAELLRTVKAALDSQYEAKLPVGILAADRARDAVYGRKQRSTYYEPPDVLDASGEQLSAEFLHDAAMTVVNVQLHKHKVDGACGKLPQGARGCRFGFDAAHPLASTKAFLITLLAPPEFDQESGELDLKWEFPDPSLQGPDCMCASDDCHHNLGTINICVEPLPLLRADADVEMDGHGVDDAAMMGIGVGDEACDNNQPHTPVVTEPVNEHATSPFLASRTPLVTPLDEPTRTPLDANTEMEWEATERPLFGNQAPLATPLGKPTQTPLVTPPNVEEQATPVAMLLHEQQTPLQTHTPLVSMPLQTHTPLVSAPHNEQADTAHVVDEEMESLIHGVEAMPITPPNVKEQATPVAMLLHEQQTPLQTHAPLVSTPVQTRTPLVSTPLQTHTPLVSAPHNEQVDTAHVVDEEMESLIHGVEAMPMGGGATESDVDDERTLVDTDDECTDDECSMADGDEHATASLGDDSADVDEKALDAELSMEPLIPRGDARNIVFELARPSTVMFDPEAKLACNAVTSRKALDQKLRAMPDDELRGVWDAMLAAAPEEVRTELGRPEWASVCAAMGKATPFTLRRLILAWGTMSCANKEVTPFAHALSSVVRCNTAHLLLGAREAARCAMFYMVKYLTS